MEVEALEDLFEVCPDGIALVEYDDGDSIIQICNEPFEQLCGSDIDSLAGESVTDYLVPSDTEQQELAADIYDAASTGETVEYEITRRTVNGIRDFLFRAMPLEKRDAMKSLEVYIDITDRARERYQALIEHSSDLITILEEDGTIRYTSPSIERILGYDPDELVGENAFEYIHKEDRRAVMDEFEKGLQNPDLTPEAEFRFSNAHGEWRTLASVGSNHIGRPPIEGYVVNSRDITARKKRERQLEWYRAYVEQQQKKRALEETRIEVNVLEAEQTDADLQDNDRYARLTTRIGELERELADLERELADLENEYDTVPASADIDVRIS
ncbi:PAS domain S-box protein [Halopenitus sp. H-Gu1]|uniref:PAS domain S-box protein n=1 Tax=Halopenitus sp. H-Gu1 TaxID=3242697 RepID=UPI00359E0137